MAAEVAKASRSWSSILSGVNVTAPESNVHSHPSAALDVQAARLMKAHHATVKLSIDVQANDAGFKAQIQALEQEYHADLDELEQQQSKIASELSASYRAAHDSLMREQRSFLELLKGLNCKAEFINHFPVPQEEQPE